MNKTTSYYYKTDNMPKLQKGGDYHPLSVRCRKPYRSFMTNALDIRYLLLALLLLSMAGLFVSEAHAGQQRPFRGAIGISVLLCKFQDSPAPAKTKQYYEDLLIKANKGTHADYWRDVSDGSIQLNGVVKGWYTLGTTIAQAQAYGGGGSANRIKKHSDCVDKAKQQGYTPPSNHLVVVITSPGIDTFGFNGGAFLGEDANVGILAHEVGHGLSLSHSFSDDPAYCNANWASVGEYDDQWDTMSYANVFTRDLGIYGRGGPWLNAYHMDRMGWLNRNRIFRFGANGVFDQTVTLKAVNRTSGSGYILARIPFDVNNLFHYYTIEYRVAESWDSGIGSDRILIHEVKAAQKKKCSDGSTSGGSAYNSYLIRDHSGQRTPRESINLNSVRIDLVSKNPTTGNAVVRIRSTRADRCILGYVWREARPSDHVCVKPNRRSEVREENRTAASHRNPGGGAYGPDTCKQGYVWREAYPGDHVCVRPASRTTARNENRIAFERRIGGAAYGPNTCKQGYVWREADAKDWVCVSGQRRTEVREENRLGPSRRQPGGGSYGPDTCKQGFVWRDAFPGDHVCVPGSRRTKARQENQQAHDRLANKGA